MAREQQETAGAMEVREARTPEVVREPRRWVVPRADVYGSDDAVVLMADLPGVKREDLDVRVERRVLTIEGRRGRLGYRRTFNLPDTVDSEHIDASLKDGVLSLRLPRTEEAKPRRISVNIGA